MLKLMEDAITPRYTSSGASSGVGTSPTCSDLRGSLSSDSTPSHIVCSVAQHVGGAVALGDGEGADVLAGRAPLDGVEDLLHGAATY